MIDNNTNTPAYGVRVPAEETVVEFKEFHATPMKPLTTFERKQVDKYLQDHVLNTSTTPNKPKPKPKQIIATLGTLTLLSTIPVFYIVGAIEIIGNIIK